MLLHPDLIENLWRNPGETGIDSKGHDKATNGIDDDKNGYIDDVSGWNFVGNNSDFADNHGHGNSTLLASVGAVGGTGVGISGESPKVSLMVLKYFDPKSKGNDNLKNTIRAIRYAVDMGRKRHQLLRRGQPTLMTMNLKLLNTPKAKRGSLCGGGW